MSRKQIFEQFNKNHESFKFLPSLVLNLQSLEKFIRNQEIFIENKRAPTAQRICKHIYVDSICDALSQAEIPYFILKHPVPGVLH